MAKAGRIPKMGRQTGIRPQGPKAKSAGMAGGTNTKKSAMAPAQQSMGNYGNGPGVPTHPITRGVPPKNAGRGSLNKDNSGAPGNVKSGTFPALPTRPGRRGR
jgi:hypothetical protein